MLSDKTKHTLNFHGGISKVSYLEHEPENLKTPSATRIIFFNNHAAPSHLSELFKRSNGKRLLDKVCSPERSELKSFDVCQGERQAMEAVEWIRNLEDKLDTELREKCEQIFIELAELELKNQVQRNLLKKV
ncbi:hypothetical protein ACJJI4_09445 [Microbulbifer sp. TRSA002]|uniref:hypothetical protein n=1 Tax=Microbulbifer sp. TRSA002 TaxID=3243382 RepID=UPI00403985D7